MLLDVFIILLLTLPAAPHREDGTFSAKKRFTVGEFEVSYAALCHCAD